jgi:hypothetical protein
MGAVVDSLWLELPASVAPRSTAASVRPRCPQPHAFGSSNRPDVRAPAKMCGGARTPQKVYCWIVMLSMYPYIESGTLFLLRKRASGTVKVFPRFVDSSAVFRAARAAECEKSPCYAKDPASCVSHLVLRSCRRIPGACISKVHMC